MTVALRRIHDEPAAAEGHRVLVDRLWPRGVRKDAGLFDEWLRDAAPSDGLRRWYGHRPERYEEFRLRYLAELADPAHAAALRRLRELAGGRLTLLTATHDLEPSHLPVLAELLGGRSAAPEQDRLAGPGG